MNSPQQVRHLLTYLTPHVGSAVSVQLVGGAVITGVLTVIDGKDTSGQYNEATLLHLATTGGPTWQVDAVDVLAAAA